MAVIIDGKSMNVVVQDAAGLKEILDSLVAEGRYVTSVVVNGEVKSLDDVLDAIPNFKEQDTIELITCTLNDLIESTMNSSGEILPLLYQALSTAAEYFRVGNLGLGSKKFSEVIPVLRWHVDMLNGFIHLHTEPSDIHDFYQRISTFIPDLLLSWENEDFVLLSDIIQYELIPWVEQWFGYVQLFQKQMVLEKMKVVH